MPLIGAGLSENFDAAIAELVVFGGEGILIDANFANGGFGRKLAPGEAVNIDLTTVGTGSRTRERLQIVLEFVGIVGEGFQIFAL